MILGVKSKVFNFGIRLYLRYKALKRAKKKLEDRIDEAQEYRDLVFHTFACVSFWVINSYSMCDVFSVTDFYPNVDRTVCIKKIDSLCFF